jgi:hypothetical protein
MDNVFKAIVTAGVINLVTGNPIIAMSIGWLAYFYWSSKNDERV